MTPDQKVIKPKNLDKNFIYKNRFRDVQGDAKQIGMVSKPDVQIFGTSVFVIFNRR
jgi:hypothetical protein